MSGGHVRAAAPLSAQQRAALIEEIARFPAPTRERGQRYAAAGRVGALTYQDGCISAAVHGTELYETLWEWIEDGWEPDCSCPVGPYCKHAYALACCVLADDPLVGSPEPRLHRLLPARLLRSLPQPAFRAPAPRPTVVQGLATLGKMKAARDVWTRQQCFLQLIGRDVAQRIDPYGPHYMEIFREPEPDMLCWRLAQAVVGATEGWLPPALEAYRERPDLTARYADRAREGLMRELVEWAAQQRQPTQRSLRVLFSLTGHLGGRVSVAVEARVTSPRMTDAPRTPTQLQQLRSELRNNPRLLPPEQAAVLEWLTDSQTSGYERYSGFGTTRMLTSTALKALLGRLGDSSVATWAAEVPPDLAARGGLTPGAAVRHRAEPARILPTCLTRGDELCVDFVVQWPDGSQRRLDEVLYVRGADDWSRHQPSLVIADGVFSAVVEEPPEELRERFAQVGGLNLPAAERGAVISLLASKFAHLHETLAGHTRHHPVTPAVAMDLRDDDWLQIRVLAHTGDASWRPGQELENTAVAFEYNAQGRWVRWEPETHDADVTGAQAYDGIRSVPQAENAASGENPSAEDEKLLRDADVWLDAPDPQQVASLLAWIETLNVVPGVRRTPSGRQTTARDRDVGWWMQASAKRMHAFATAWEERPPGVSFFGTERVRRLLAGEERVTPVLSIESSGIDWFTVSAEWEAEGQQLSDADLAKLRSATTRFVKLSSGWVRRDVSEVHDEAAHVLADLGIEAGRGEQRLSIWQLAGASPQSLEALEHFGADANVVRTARALRERVAQFSGLPEVALPAGLTVQLRPYQHRGLDFLAYTSSLGIGAVLADDMGLGKTVQALAWLLHLREIDPDGGPSLVVCPASVVHNWAREAARFTPHLRVLLLTSGQSRHALRQAIPAHDLIVTNYALLRRDIEAWRTVELRAAILDEAQNIKNPDAVVTRAALTLRARHRLALTGTPLENRALDLWSIVSFVNPGYLGNRAQFQNRFDRLDAPPHARTLLAAKLRPVLLRRTKQAVASDLPPRIEERLDCDLTTEQRLLYLAELRRSRALVEHLSAAPGGITQNKIHILAALTRLRQICCHPALAGGKKSLGSGKFEALFELLEPLLDEGHKVLLFSQFVECLQLLKAELRERDIAHHMLTGQTVKRQQVVDAFQSDARPSVFLVSLKAGGTGLNLTAASYVVLFDPWWNPAVEAQAIDRTHRIGQDRTVIAYRMLTTGTIEEKIWELQQRKAALARDILGEGGFARALTRCDLDYLLAEA